MPAIRELLAEANLSLVELDGIVLGNGPGSFIGLRIAASVAQGLAYASGLKLLPVSSLVAVAAESLADAEENCVIVAQDARMGEVYLGFYTLDDYGTPHALLDEQIYSAGALALPEKLLGQAWLAAGAGWSLHPKLLTENPGLITTTSAVLYPQARYLLPAGERCLSSGGAIEPALLEPAYLRRQVAQPAAPISG